MVVFVVTVFLGFVAVGLYQACTRPNIMLLSIFDNGRLDVADIHSVLLILYTLCRLKLYDAYAFGRCTFFLSKPSVSAASIAGIGHCQI